MPRSLPGSLVQAGIAIAALWVVPPLGLLVLFLFAPAVTAWITSRPDPDRNTYQAHGVVAAVTLALASAVWVAVNPDETQNVFAVMASFVVTFLVISVATVVVIILVSNRFPKER
ncbi:MAG TPA: hypothetical protein PKA49_05585 [Tepidiformaceae bacterium]|jgi:apolipoprotein N-acyltransferase|nr:hypothetical protein [Thermoflexaceae bacterium]HMS58309.1 hypothetical protein [Tepidiformaceae bacterium]